MKIGFSGLGIMGSRMAANIQKKLNHELTVHNRTRSKAEQLLANGAAWAETPAEAGKDADIFFSMLSTPAVVRQTALGRNGFLDVLHPGALWVDCSTVNPSFTKEMAEAAAGRGVHFVDAPVAGSKGPVEAGTVTFLVGGEAEDVELLQPFFFAMGSKVLHMGGVGSGSAMKMVSNLLLGINMLVFSEALVLGQGLGIPQKKLLDTLAGLTITAPHLFTKRSKIETNDFEVEFPLRWLVKDLNLASLSGYEQGLALPATNLVKELYALAMRNGLGDKDFSAIYQLIAQTTGK